MFSPTEYRLRYGDVFVVEAPDGTIIPWAPLSLGDFLRYDKAFKDNIVIPALLEDEIFKLCVRDTFLVNNIATLKAGTVSFVASTIMRYSVPQNEEEFEFLLNSSRNKIISVFHQVVAVITQAFPAYTPDELYKMDIYTLSDRLALAESKLLQTGFIKEPLAFFSKDKKKKRPEPRKSKIDLSKLKKEYDDQSKPKISPPPREEGQTIISTGEMLHNIDTDSQSETPAEAQMLNDAKIVYKDYMEQLKKGKKVAIKSVDERVAESKKRVEENRKKFREAAKRSKK